jgi:hypothetical protein
LNAAYASATLIFLKCTYWTLVLSYYSHVSCSLPNCGHHFCGACLKELFDRNQDVDWRCPACRTVVHDQPVDLWLAKNINQLLLEAQAIFRCCGMNTVDIARPTDPRPRLKQLFDTTLRTDNADSFFDSLRARNRARRRFGRQAV